MQTRDELVETMARSDAAFDGRPWGSMGRSERARYSDRSRAALAAIEVKGAVMLPTKATPEIEAAVQAAYEANPTITGGDAKIKPALWDFFATGWPAAVAASPFRAEG